MSTITVPDEVDCSCTLVIEGLFIGSVLSAQSEVNLARFEISAILSVGCEIKTVNDNIECLSFPSIKDTPEQILFDIWKKSNEFIDECLKKEKRVLVHCVYGQSRSASVIIAYLVSVLKYDIDMSLRLLKEAQPSICINPGFLCQLFALSTGGFSSSIVRLISRNVDIIKANDESNSLTESGFFCQVCRQKLVNEDHEIQSSLPYQDFLNKHVDNFWKEYYPIHPEPKSWFSQCPIEGHIILPGFPLFETSNKSKRRKLNNSKNITQDSNIISEQQSETDLRCPGCATSIGYYKKRGLLVCNRFLAVDLFALRNECIIKRRKII